MFYAAAREGEVALLAAFLDAGIDPDRPDDRGFTPLILASYHDRAEAVALLLARGAAVDGRDADGSTALGGVAFKGYEPIARQLLDAGAAVDTANGAGRTPLIFATMFGRVSLAALLVRHGADPHRADGEGNSAAAPGPAERPRRPGRGTRARMTLGPEDASRFAAVALGHVRREYPYKPGNVLAGPQDARTPRDLHPAFGGSFDWHSCVHATWMLARLLRLYPAMAPAAEIRALFDAQLTPGTIAAECATFEHPMAAGYERPYGWAWLLRLSQALADLPERRWAAALDPLRALIDARLRAFLPKATYPVRVGTHFNTAFALAVAADYAVARGDGALHDVLRRAAEGWYGADADCQAWEPGGDDFLSSALMEAECMRRLLPPDRFLTWFGRFLPHLTSARPATLFAPAAVSDRSDGKIAHLDGLNLSRAWCWRGLATALPPEDPRRVLMGQAAALHLDAGLPHVAGDYMGEHWLASFAVLALDAPSPGG